MKNRFSPICQSSLPRRPGVLLLRGELVFVLVVFSLFSAVANVAEKGSSSSSSTVAESVPFPPPRPAHPGCFFFFHLRQTSRPRPQRPRSSAGPQREPEAGSGGGREFPPDAGSGGGVQAMQRGTPREGPTGAGVQPALGAGRGTEVGVLKWKQAALPLRDGLRSRAARGPSAAPPEPPAADGPAGPPALPAPAEDAEAEAADEAEAEEEEARELSEAGKRRVARVLKRLRKGVPSGRPGYDRLALGPAAAAGAEGQEGAIVPALGAGPLVPAAGPSTLKALGDVQAKFTRAMRHKKRRLNNKHVLGSLQGMVKKHAQPGSAKRSKIGGLEVPEDEMILQVSVNHCDRPKVALQRFLVLGSQKLSELRDKIECYTDAMCESVGFRSKSGFFYIGNKFYDDMRREGNVRYSTEVLHFIRKRQEARAKQGRGPGAGSESIFLGGQPGAAEEKQYECLNMEDTTFNDLFVTLGPYAVYCHRGACEHLMHFHDVRLFHKMDESKQREYPLQIAGVKPSALREMCRLCHKNVAKKVVYGGPLVEAYPEFLCIECDRSLHYTKEGQLVCEDFECYEYPEYVPK